MLQDRIFLHDIAFWNEFNVQRTISHEINLLWINLWAMGSSYNGINVGYLRILLSFIMVFCHCYITQLSFLLKLPDSHTLDLHGSIVSLPGRIPLILSLPELLRAVTVLVIPGLGISFIAYSIREETICSSNCDVDDEVKLKIYGKKPAMISISM